jgi:hypothetical protein
VHGGDPGPTIRIDLLRGGIPPFVRAEAPPPPPLTAAAHPTWLSYAALCAKQGESSAGRTETSSGTIAARCSCRSSSRSAAGAFLKKMSSPPISEDGNPFDTGQRDRCTLRNRGGAAAEVASPCAFVYNIIYQYYISIESAYVYIVVQSVVPLVMQRDYAPKGWLGMRHVSISIRASVAPHYTLTSLSLYLSSCL